MNQLDKYDYHIIECNGSDIDYITKGRTLQEFYDETLDGIKNHFHKNPIVKEDVLSLFQYEGKTIKDVLDERNV